MRQDEREFAAQCLNSLRKDLETLLRNRSYELKEVEEKRADLQETVRRLNMDMLACDMALRNLEVTL